MGRLLPYLIRFVFLAAIGWVFFSAGLNAAFVSDFIQWAYTYKLKGVGGIAGSFDDASLHHFQHLASFVWYSMFGLNETAWGMLQIGLHALNALLLGYMVGILSKRIGTPISSFGTLAISILFMLSPYQTEAVIWSAALHFLITTAMVLGIMLLLFKAERANMGRNIVLAHVLFAVSLFTLELSLTLPFLLLIVLCLIPQYALPGFSVKRFLISVTAPQLLFMVVYFVLNKLTFGSPVGHYGASKHLNFDVIALAQSYLKYAIKWLGYLRYWGNVEIYRSLNTMLDGPVLILIVTAVIVLGLLYFGIRAFVRGNVKSKLMLCFFMLAAAALLPVINLETTSLFEIQSDRYGYFASLFLYAALGLVIINIPLPRLRYMVLTFVLLLNTVLLISTVNKWHAAGNVMKGMLNSFVWTDSPQVLILNVPDNCDGVYLFRQGLREAISLYNNDMALKSRILMMAKYTMLSPNDSISVNITGTNSLIQGSVLPGSWFMYSDEGNNSYTTDIYKVQFYDGNYWFLLDVECMPSGSAIIYQAGNAFKQIQPSWITDCP